MEREPSSDETLLAAIAHASPDERRRLANELFDRYYERIARWCYRFTGDREAAADLAQEVFVKAYRHLDTFRGASRFSTWLYSIARNEGLTRRQRQPMRHVDDDEEALASLPALEEGPDAAVEQERRREHVHRLLADTLDDVERTVFVLHYADDMTLDQITRLLGFSNPSGAKAYIVSAKRKLARTLRRMKAAGEAW